jgi:hypothetical protein
VVRRLGQLPYGHSASIAICVLHSLRCVCLALMWSFIKSKKQDISGVAPLRAKDDIIYSDNNNKAEILNNQFKSAYTLEDTFVCSGLMMLVT